MHLYTMMLCGSSAVNLFTGLKNMTFNPIFLSLVLNPDFLYAKICENILTTTAVAILARISRHAY